MHPRLSLFFVAIFCFAASHGSASSASTKPERLVTGKVVHVTDGDTLWLATAGSPDAIKVRFTGIDAPESCQDWGREATAALKSQALHQNAVVITSARDSYGRLLGRVRINGQDMGAWMVANGHAWSQHYHRSNGPYAAQERSAQHARHGLWAAGNPLEPKLFRKQHGSCKP